MGVLRGGSWNNNNSNNLRAANRNHNAPDNRNNNAGFRCASTSTAGSPDWVVGCDTARVDRFTDLSSVRSGFMPIVGAAVAVFCATLAARWARAREAGDGGPTSPSSPASRARASLHRKMSTVQVPAAAHPRRRPQGPR
jgi:hypothetical protein